MPKILAIEAESQVLKEITDILTEIGGHEVQGAGDSLSGFQLTHAYRPDLILCDTALPGPDGLSFLRHLRGDQAIAHIPLILIGNKPTWGVIRAGMELGADDYLMKPLSADVLLGAVEGRLKRYTDIIANEHQSLERAKQTLLRMVTHELRTPLVPVNMATEIISRQMGNMSSEQLRELLDTISAGTRRLSRLIEQMVYVTQIEAGALHWGTVSNSGMTTRLWDVLLVSVDLARRYAYRHPDIMIRMEENDSDTCVLADKAALKQALAEVITNAINFSPPSAEIEISQWRSGSEIWISVVDRGPGIPAEELQNVLEGFHQIDREKQDQQGVGLGLMLAKGVVEAHGGRLELRSVVGKGTQVMVGLPVVD